MLSFLLSPLLYLSYLLLYPYPLVFTIPSPILPFSFSILILQSSPLPHLSFTIPRMLPFLPSPLLNPSFFLLYPHPMSSPFPPLSLYSLHAFFPFLFTPLSVLFPPFTLCLHLFPFLACFLSFFINILFLCFQICFLFIYFFMLYYFYSFLFPSFFLS